MISDFANWLQQLENPDMLDAFRFGYLAGTLFVVLLLIVIKIVQYFFLRGPRRSGGIAIPGEYGELFISANAITDLARAVCMEYDPLELSRVTLRERKDGFLLELLIDFDRSGGNFPELAAELQSRLLDELAGRLGIDCVRGIKVKLRHLTARKNSPFK